ncbi:MAG: DUF4384 domain-containing protein, partial [Singulisphaera sp.]
RDMTRVPRPPELVTLRTGDRVRVEVVADRPGHVAVFNVGPTGNLNLLYPDGPLGDPPTVEPHRPLHVPDIEMAPPTGRERLFAVWSRRPLPLHPEDLFGLVERGDAPGSVAYRATRDMRRVQDAVRQLRPGDYQVALLELDHLPKPRSGLDG